MATLHCAIAIGQDGIGAMDEGTKGTRGQRGTHELLSVHTHIYTLDMDKVMRVVVMMIMIRILVIMMTTMILINSDDNVKHYYCCQTAGRDT